MASLWNSLEINWNSSSLFWYQNHCPADTSPSANTFRRQRASCFVRPPLLWTGISPLPSIGLEFLKNFLLSIIIGDSSISLFSLREFYVPTRTSNGDRRRTENGQTSRNRFARHIHIFAAILLVVGILEFDGDVGVGALLERHNCACSDYLLTGLMVCLN